MKTRTVESTLEGNADATLGSSHSHWHHIELPEGSVGLLNVSVYYTGPLDSVGFELVDTQGQKVATANAEAPNAPGHVRDAGLREAVLEHASGNYYAHVVGTGRYSLAFSFQPTPIALDARIDCDPLHVDPANPACAGIKPCDPNKPDMTNPTCCDVVCFTDRACSRHLLPVDDPDAPPNAVWLDMGAKDGLHRRYRGWVDYTASDGKTMQVSLDIVDIQDSRSMIYLPKPPDKTRLQYGGAHIRPPDECIHGR